MWNFLKRKQHRKFKLGVTYSLFSGEELLEQSIKSIRNQVDYINVVYQKKSWYGNDVSPDVPELLKRLKEKGLIDTCIEYVFTDFSNHAKISHYVLDKKSKGIDDLRKNHCTHCMIMDVDEFYIEEEFKAAKEFIYKNNISHSCCSIYDYKISPTYRKRDVNNYAVPFIFKLTKKSKLSEHHNIPCTIDPLRAFRFIDKKDKFYYLNTVVMHHMTGIRNDFDKKLDNSVTNSISWGKEFLNKFRNNHLYLSSLTENELLENGYILVEDIFHLKGQSL